MAESFERFPLDLDEEQERRAKQVLQKSIVIDLLYQGPLGMADFTPEMSKQLQAVWEANRNPVALLLAAMDLPVALAARGQFESFRRACLATGITAAGNRQVELADPNLLAASFAMAQRQFDSLDWMTKALTGDDFRKAKADGTSVGLISTQLVFGPPASIDTFDHAYGLGLRMVQLTYNYLTSIGAGCTERTDAGISHFGATVIKRLNDLGIIVDTGHCGRQTTLDACELSEHPVVASHTSAASLCGHDRAKSDDELRAIAQTGGAIGIYAVPFFLSEKPETADLNLWLDHVDYVSQLVGPEHVAIGTDWPMQLPEWVLVDVFAPLTTDIGFRSEHNIIDPRLTLAGFSSYREFPNFARGLVARGYSDQEIEGILGGNFLRVFEKVCG